MLGRRVEYCGEAGVIVHESPTIMQCSSGNFYVPVVHTDHLVLKDGVEETRPVKPDLVDRIQKYVDSVSDRPSATGVE